MAEGNLRNLPLGFRFCPNETESIRYLKRKNRGEQDFIPVYDISHCKPDQLPQNCFTKGKRGELYFYTERDPNKSRQRRMVGDDCFWRNTNNYKPIKHQGKVIGQKTNLVFHTGRPGKSKKTDWMMQEYSLLSATSPGGSCSSAEDVKLKKVGKFVLCKIYTKARGEVSFDSIDDALMDEDGKKKRIAFWSYILEHEDDENILEEIVE